jgi:hypothetical protein
VAEYTQAIKLEPETAWVYDRRGLAFVWLNQPEMALADFEYCHQLDPDNLQVSLMFCWLKLYLDLEEDQALILHELAALAEADANSYQSYIAAGILSGLNDGLVESLGQLDDAVELKPQEPWAYFWWGLFAAKMNLALPAQEALKVALQLHLPPLLLQTMEVLARNSQFYQQYGLALTAPAQPLPALLPPPEEAAPKPYTDFLNELNESFNEEARTEDLSSIIARYDQRQTIQPSPAPQTPAEIVKNELFGRELKHHTEKLREITHQLRLMENQNKSGR